MPLLPLCVIQPLHFPMQRWILLQSLKQGLKVQVMGRLQAVQFLQLKGAIKLKQLPPETIEDGSIRVQSDHSVLHCHPVDKGLLVINEVCVRDPQLVCHPVVQCEVERDAGVGEALVPPGLLEVHGDGVVL